MSNLGDKLRALAAEADGAMPLQLGGRVREPFRPNAVPFFDSNGVCTADFWVKGYLGCAKGAYGPHYTIAWQTLSMMGGTGDASNTVLLAGTPQDNWNLNLASVADALWMDGDGYYYNPQLSPAENSAVYEAFGRPTHNSKGWWDVRGQPLNAKDIAAALAAIKQARGG